MPIVKPKAPEYPRPVSPICADEVPICKDSIVYYDQEGGVEEGEKERAAKRRRIEAYATAHLRGQPVFILSAGLRGPFGDGWQNPWAKQKRTDITKTETSQQIPGQHIKPTNPTAQTPPISSKKQQGQAAAELHTLFTGQKKDRFADDRGLMLSSTRKRRTLETSISGDILASSDHRTKGWLKTSQAYKTPEGTRPEPSPPSPSERGMKTRESSRLVSGISVRDDAAIANSNRGDLSRPRISSSKPPEQLMISFSSPMKSRTVPADEKPSDCRSSSVKPGFHQTPLRKRDSNAQPAWTDESRAEYAILQSKRTAAQLTAAVMDSGSGPSNPADAQSPKLRLSSSKAQEMMHVNRIAEVRPGLNHPPTPPNARKESPLKGATDIHSASSDASASLKTAQEGPSSSHQDTGPPSREKETTGSSATAELPSAQLPEALISPSLPSNISSHVSMLRDGPHDGSTAPGAVEDHDRAADLECPLDNAVHFDTPNAATHGLQPLGKLQAGYEGPTVEAPQENTKGTVNSIGVSDTATSTGKILKAVPGGGRTATSPVGMKKAGALKSRKRQAFANEDKSSGSIKSALRVAKAAPNLEDMAVYKITHGYGDDLRLDENEVHRALPRDETSPRVTGASVPRSILKASLQHSTGVSAPSSSSTKQDAQRQRMLNLIENDNFDLDGAIDDLGSFLDTWDAEKHEAGVS